MSTSPEIVRSTSAIEIQTESTDASPDVFVANFDTSTVPTEPLVAWVAENADAPTPTTIRKDTDGWKAE